MRTFLKEIFQDERDRFSSSRTAALSLFVIAVVLAICGIFLALFSVMIADRCKEVFKFLLGPTGPVVILFGASQAKTAISNVASAIKQVPTSSGTKSGERKKIAGPSDYDDGSGR